MSITLLHIHRYPVKSLSAQILNSVFLRRGEGLPQDRRFAFLHQGGNFDVPCWKPPQNFLSLKYYDLLATLETEYDEISSELSIFRKGRLLVAGRLDRHSGRVLVEDFFTEYMKEVAPVPVRLIEYPGIMFTDDKEKFVSILNLRTVHHLQNIIQKVINPIRFRTNFLIDGLKEWTELSWIGRDISIGGVRLKVAKYITRCAATNVDPVTGISDLNIPRLLVKEFRHCYCGVLARVVESGTVSVGDEVFL